MLGAPIPSWEPQPDVWLLVAAFGVGYLLALTRLGPREAGASTPATRLQIASFALGVLALWIAADWPIHQIAEQRLYSVHMIQHLMLTMVVVPLLLLGTPAWLLRWMLQPGSLGFRAIRSCARFLPGLLIFNAVLVFNHWPEIVNASLANGFVHFLLHALLFLSSIIVWLPVLSPLPEIPRLALPVRGLYLFAWSIVPTVPASFLTFGSQPLYSAYTPLPKLWGLTPLEDQQIAGLIVKIGAGLLLWMLIAVIFFRWAADEERDQHPARRPSARTTRSTPLGTRSLATQPRSHDIRR